MIKRRYHKCCKCNKIATWLYMSANNGYHFYCDEHVPRGCYCQTRYIEIDGIPKSDNIMWLNKEHTSYEYLDNKGRKFPCCEYNYKAGGQEFTTVFKLIKKDDILKAFHESKHHLKNISIIDNINAFIKTFSKQEIIDYNEFMRKFCDVCTPFMKYQLIGKGKDAQSFYNSFKNKCNNLSYKKYE